MNELPNTTIFVTGGAGFIGSAVCLRGQRRQTNLCGEPFVHSTTARPPRYAFEKVDICDGPALRRLFDKYAPRVVMNLAAESHVDRSIDVIEIG